VSHFVAKIFATPMRKCVVAMTAKMPVASELFGKIEAPHDAIRLTLWTEGVFVARDRHVAESEKSRRWWHTSGAVVVWSSHDRKCFTRHRWTVTRAENQPIG
jgi:hypothetical protein